jgi:hypothetical protein
VPGNAIAIRPGIRTLAILTPIRCQRLSLISGTFYQGTAPVTPLFSVRVKLAQFLFVIGLDGGQLGYSLKTEGNGPVSQPSSLHLESQPVGMVLPSTSLKSKGDFDTA